MILLRRLGPALFALFGTVMAFHPMILSGFQRMETDPGDARHLNYVLEHGYQWLRSTPGHRDLWSPPVFFPERNTAAYSETLLGVLPFYLFWRFFGFPPDTSLQLLTIAVSLLNFAAAYLLLRRSLKFEALSSSIGAFLFSFGSPRIVHSQHIQLLSQFFMLPALAALIGLFQPSEESGRGRRAAWIFVFFASLVAQFYASFYLAWLIIFALGVASVAALFVKQTRHRLVSLIRQSWPVISGCVVFSAAAVAPVVRHYLEAASVVGYRTLGDVAKMLPTPWSWFNLGPYSWIYGSVWRWWGFADVPYEPAKRLGIGFVTSVLAAYGLYRERNRSGVRVLLGSAVVLIVFTTTLPGGLMLWKAVFDCVPGARAIRAVGRVAFILLLPACIGVAYAFERASKVVPKFLLSVFALIVVFEQGQTMPSYNKVSARQGVQRVAEQVPGGCEAFFAVFLENRRPVWETHLDAMWAGMQMGVPTVNGYSSNLPPGWGSLLDNRILDPADETRVRLALGNWLVSRGQDPTRTCLVRVP